MKIIQLKAENFKRISAIEITPAGNVVTITGKNEAGKSSVLDAIWAALGGGKAQPLEPVRRGCELATVTLDLGEYIVTRTWDVGGGSKLTVKARNGAIYKSPQALLDGFLGAYTFDPAVFLNAKNQREILLDTIMLNVDWSRWKEPQLPGIDRDASDPLTYIDMVRKSVYEQRRELGREVKRLEKTAQTLACDVDLQKTWERISVADVIAARDRAIAHNRRIEEQTKRYEALEKRADAIRSEIRKLQDELMSIENELKTTLTLDEPIDLKKYDAQIFNAEAHNIMVDKAERARATFEEMRAAMSEYDNLTRRIEAIDRFKNDLLENAKLPVPGLGFDLDGNITLNDIPLAQCSHAQRLKVAMAIAMAGNPKLRIMRVSDGEKFDSDSWRIIEEMAKENDFQVWIEKMDESGEIGIYIEDGRIGGIEL